jgi:hypothetical protein
MELKSKYTGDINTIRQMMDVLHLNTYLLSKNIDGTWSLYLEELPPYNNLYENILHYESIRYSFNC